MKFNQRNTVLEIGDKIFTVEEQGKDFIRVEIEQNELQDIVFNPSTFLDDLFIRTFNETGFDTYLFHDLEIFKDKKTICFVLICHQPNKYWEGKYGLSTLLMELCQNINLTENLRADPETLEIQDDWKRLEITYHVDKPSKFSDIIDKFSREVIKVIKHTERLLSGAVWRKEYEKNEKLFSTEILYPLLRKMNFHDVRFTHGIREYGKDFTFSDISPFGNMRHYGMQVKAGNMRGNVNADIDEIIGQLEDAFGMSYHEITANEERRINTFIISISGNFTDNAKDKIASKIPNSLKGSVYMLDKEKIMELIEKFWK